MWPWVCHHRRENNSAQQAGPEQDLQASKDRLQLALDAAQLGWWQGDTRSKEIFDFPKNEATIQEIISLCIRTT
jgi:hypothetical protein